MSKILESKWLCSFSILLLFLLIYFQVLFANYAYLDEIHQLWHNHDRSNYFMFSTQGRWLAGLLINKLFASISNIDDLKYLRIFSLSGWIITTMIWYVIFKKWIFKLNLDKGLLILTTIYVIAGIPTAVYIGWASCLEIFLAIIAGLLSGNILFNTLHGKTGFIDISFTALFSATALGVISLFFYQNAFGIFLLPFFLYYINQKTAKFDRIMKIGILFYLLVYLIYYALFKYSLHFDHVQASDRTGISLNIIQKIPFFFSGPIPTSFSLNHLYETQHILPQVIAILFFSLWLISVFIRKKQEGFLKNVSFVFIIFILLALIYLPSMIAKENFASYRTLFVFNIAVFLLLLNELFYYIKKENFRNRWTWGIAIVLILLAIYNFNFQFINPLKKEYNAFKGYMKDHFVTGIDTVYFIRPDKKLFPSIYSVVSSKDEFGSPSTLRDWVPEPLVKQTVLELTGDRSQAEKITVVQFSSQDSFELMNRTLTSQNLLIDMNEIVRGNKQTASEKK